MVLKDNRAPIHDPRGKFRPNWTGPYIIKAIWSGGAVVLMDLDGLKYTQPIIKDKLARQAENPKGQPRQKLEHKKLENIKTELARSKTRKGQPWQKLERKMRVKILE